MPALNKKTVCSMPHRTSWPMGTAIQRCPNKGLVIVTLAYGAGGMLHDADVEITPGYTQKQRKGDVFTFEIEEDALYEVEVRSQHWSVKFGHEYVGQAEPVHTTTITVPLYPRPALTLTCRDHHFAPGAETLDAFFTVTNLEADTIKLTIRGTNYGGDTVHRNDDAGSADGDHPLGWQGQVNVGALNTRLVTPLCSPYTIRVEGEHSGLSAEVEFRVLYRQVDIALGSYTADGNAPNMHADHDRWIQYKLNELGYFAGPVDGNIPQNGQTHRAMQRYAYQHPALDESMAQHGNFPAFPNDPTFVAALQNNEQPLGILQGGALPAMNSKAKAYIEHNYFYYTLAEFAHPTGHLALDTAKLDRFELPLEVTVSLMSQTDPDGTHPGVATHAAAVGDVKVEWIADEWPEDLRGLPAPTANSPSRGQDYLVEALQQTMENYRNNCPVALGGARQPVGQVNQGHFAIGAQIPPYTSTTAGDRVFSNAHQGAHVARVGKAGILFRGSYIAGDSFQIRAHLSFHGLPNMAALEAEHRAVLGVTWQERLEARTGILEIWRRHRVSHVIDWPAPTAGGPIQWAEVAAEYAPAYCELDYGNITNITGAQLLANYQDVNGRDLQTLMGGMVGFTLGTPLYGTFNFNGNCIVPLPAIPPQNADEHAAQYKKRALAYVESEITSQAKQNLACGIAQMVDSRSPPGTTVIRGQWCPTIQLQHRVNVFFTRVDTSVEAYNPGLYCVGLARGVTIFSNEMYPDYQHGFLVAHEAGHSRFLSHHETGKAPQADPHHVNDNSDNPGDHDLNDHNCTMCYPWGVVSRPGLNWEHRDATRAHFCGKCLLKLRGWDVANPLMPRQSP